MQAIVQALATAQAELVLIGPRCAGVVPGGQRLIDYPADFMHHKVAADLVSIARVVQMLLPGVQMLAASEPPAPLQPLARRNALAQSAIDRRPNRLARHPASGHCARASVA